jgi:peptidoglycan/LPS O-acetylase OafA/YrhL
MPLWLAGFLAYYVRRPNLSVTGSWLVVTLLLLVTACGAVYLPEYPLNLGVKPFFYSNRFLTDYALGIFFSAALWCVPYYASNVSAGFVKRLRLVSDLSFPMYLLHFPLFIAWRLVFGRTENDVAQMLFATAVVITSTGIIGYILEKQKYEWVRFFNWLTSFTIVRMAIPKPKPRPTAQPIA